MSRDIPFDPEEICDLCGGKGALDFMGDLICPECLAKGETDKQSEPRGNGGGEDVCHGQKLGNGVAPITTE